MAIPLKTSFINPHKEEDLKESSHFILPEHFTELIFHKVKFIIIL